MSIESSITQNDHVNVEAHNNKKRKHKKEVDTVNSKDRASKKKKRKHSKQDDVVNPKEDEKQSKKTKTKNSSEDKEKDTFGPSASSDAVEKHEKKRKHESKRAVDKPERDGVDRKPEKKRKRDGKDLQRMPVGVDAIGQQEQLGEKKKKKRAVDESDAGAGIAVGSRTDGKETPGHETGVEATTNEHPTFRPAPVPSDSEVARYLSKHGVTIYTGTTTSSAPELHLPDALKPILSFSSLLPRIPEKLHGAVRKFKEPTPIQACSWPPSLEGRDVVGVAETGSGKTLAFGIPAVAHIVARNVVDSTTKSTQKKSKKRQKSTTVRVRVLAIAPTRELALQTHGTFTELGTPFGLESVALYGGVDKAPQRAALAKIGAAMVVGTPGRILDLVNEGACDLSGVSYLVLDEADRMLDKGFENDIRTIIGRCAPSEERQTLMFSATWPDAVRRLASTFLRDPVRVTVGSDDLTANRKVEQVVEVFDDQREKDSRLLAHLRRLQPRKAKHNTDTDSDTRILIFVLYKKEASRVEQILRQQGFRVGGIHGDLSQPVRMAALEAFKKGETRLLVATDVAARGLDIPDVGTVINYSFPLTVEDYVHRIGRTGRGGRTGKSITFFTGDGHEKALAGELAKVMRENGFDTTPLKKFPMTIKKKEHSVYGAFYRDDIPVNAKPTRMKFD